VMFTAIMTGMLGLFWLSWLGFVELSLIKVLPTYLVPQLIGGLVFGVGFVMGGYCPGTCCVAAVTGRMDGWIHLAGMFSGIILFGELYPLIQDWHSSTSLGDITLPQLFDLSYGIVGMMIVLVALAAFYCAERVESRRRTGE